MISWLASLVSNRSYRHTPQTKEEIGAYSANFERAARFTAACSFPPIDVTWSGKSIDEDGNALEAALAAAGVDDVGKSAGQCFKWSHYLAPFIGDAVGCEAWVTVGQIWYKDKAVFNPSWEDLKRWALKGLQRDDFEGRMGMNLHAWITLSSGEIVDPTICSSLAMVNPDTYGKMNGGVIWGRDPQAMHNHRYFPMAIGDDFVEAISERSMMPLLAADRSELADIPVCIQFDPRRTRH